MDFSNVFPEQEPFTAKELAASIRTDAEYARKQIRMALDAEKAAIRVDCTSRALDALERILEACNTELTDNSNREE